MLRWRSHDALAVTKETGCPLFDLSCEGFNAKFLPGVSGEPGEGTKG